MTQFFLVLSRMFRTQHRIVLLAGAALAVVSIAVLPPTPFSGAFGRADQWSVTTVVKKDMAKDLQPVSKAHYNFLTAYFMSKGRASDSSEAHTQRNTAVSFATLPQAFSRIFALK
jgi:hypothetical protein